MKKHHLRSGWSCDSHLTEEECRSIGSGVLLSSSHEPSKSLVRRDARSFVFKGDYGALKVGLGFFIDEDTCVILEEGDRQSISRA
ncbi:hypothetical protein F2Q69_00055380 [Brassica cretica]|uniref:Uncharacterized protein n=1 Tax=Brassica cretica TaxID=69181 RepID=A0A8S9MPX6_BRACR|nr:hypothetical protein F2Q69_00055380 [Brassica cretica]